MDVAVKNFKHCQLISIKGRVDSSTAPKLTETFDALHREGHYKLVLDLSETEYMSSAGFRAILSTQQLLAGPNPDRLQQDGTPSPAEEDR